MAACLTLRAETLHAGNHLIVKTASRRPSSGRSTASRESFTSLAKDMLDVSCLTRQPYPAWRVSTRTPLSCCRLYRQIVFRQLFCSRRGHNPTPLRVFCSMLEIISMLTESAAALVFVPSTCSKLKQCMKFLSDVRYGRSSDDHAQPLSTSFVLFPARSASSLLQACAEVMYHGAVSPVTCNTKEKKTGFGDKPPCGHTTRESLANASMYVTDLLPHSHNCR